MLSNQYEPIREILFLLVVSGWESYLRVNLGQLSVDPKKEPVLGKKRTEGNKSEGLHTTGIPYDMVGPREHQTSLCFLLCDMINVLSVKPTGSQNVP